MKQNLSLKVSQQLAIGPQLQQSLHLLQISSQDLEHEIQDAVDTNPLLERVEAINPTISGETSNHNLRAADLDTIAGSQAFELDWRSIFKSHFNPDWENDTQADLPGQIGVELNSKEETFTEHLAWQVQMTSLSQRDKTIANTLLHSLDDQAYLTIELSEVCGLFSADIMVLEDEVKAVLSLIKTLDPVGTGAKNLQERLSILLKHNALDSNAQRYAAQIVNDHFQLLTARNFTKLGHLLQINESELATSLHLITQLNPRITNRFKSDNQNYVLPDLLVEKSGDQWVAKLNPDNQNKLRTNQVYIDLLKSGVDTKSSDYIQKNLVQAKLFIKGLMSRYDTLLLVGQTIVDRQQQFFEHGPQKMRAMVLRDIAEQLEMHESTISRATTGKYLQSPRGLLELKYFFSSALNTADGEPSSSTAIRFLIQEMIDSESKSKPLSDSRIAAKLEQLGHLVARRTVAKYRDKLQIAPSHQRKMLQ